MERYSVIITSILKGEETSTNSVATIFAWTGALRKRGETGWKCRIGSSSQIRLEKATIDTIEAGRDDERSGIDHDTGKSNRIEQRRIY